MAETPTPPSASSGWTRTDTPAPPPPPHSDPMAGYGRQPSTPQSAGQASQGSAQPVVRAPGMIPLRPLAVSEILDGAFVVIRRHPRATLGVSAAFACAAEGSTLLVRAAFGTVS